jgi:endonuclease/exonuclease/phosphatase family metal-dependent hydrolase
VASLLTILSLNTNKRADLGGLHAILKETKPHLVFLQEVVSYNAASALASAFGYTLSASTLHRAQQDLILVTLTRLPATVLEIRPGMAQLVTVGALPFINLHAPSAETPTFFPSLRPHLDSPIAPVLIGDFNVVQDPMDYTPGPARPPCLALSRILNEFAYTDSFRSLHPTSRIILSTAETHQLLVWTEPTCRPSWSPAPE